MVHIPGRCPSRESHPGRERGGHTRFLSAFRAMEMRPASQEGHTPTGKRPGLIGMSGMSVPEKDPMRFPFPAGLEPLSLAAREEPWPGRCHAFS